MSLIKNEISRLDDEINFVLNYIEETNYNAAQGYKVLQDKQVEQLPEVLEDNELSSVEIKDGKVINRIISAVPQLAQAAMGVATLAVGQYYMKQINSELAELNSSISKLADFHFDGDRLIVKYEHCYIEKEFKGNQRADKK